MRQEKLHPLDHYLNQNNGLDSPQKILTHFTALKKLGYDIDIKNVKGEGNG